MSANAVVGRFAPSPTGRMHAGNIYAALMSWLIVKAQGGTIVLRIEDLDEQRSRVEFSDQVQRDLEALGLTWDEGPFFQHDRADAYRAAYSELDAQGLLYPCFCTRADLHAASAPHAGDRFIYAGTCRNLSPAERDARALKRAPAFRVIADNRTIAIDDLIQGRYEQNLARECGDFIVRRSDGMFAYQLAVVVDDAEQHVNCIVRGVDLLDSCPQQRYLQELLGLDPCHYAHVPLVMSASGRRLSKRDADAGLDRLMAAYGSPEGVVGHIAWLAGLTAADEPVTCEDLLRDFDLNAYADHMYGQRELQWK